MELTAFWDMALCSLIVDRCFRGAYCLRNQVGRRDDVGSTHLWNVGLILQAYMAPYPSWLNTFIIVAGRTGNLMHKHVLVTIFIQTQIFDIVLNFYCRIVLRFTRNYINFPDEDSLPLPLSLEFKEEMYFG
jgi:hypothetical protein